MQSSVVMISFAMGTGAVRLHMESAVISATDRAAEECRRMELANVAMCHRKCFEIRSALLNVTSTMQTDCWHDAALCGVVLRRLKGWQDVRQEQEEAEQRLQEMTAAASCFGPILEVTDVCSFQAPQDCAPLDSVTQQPQVLRTPS